MIEKYFHNHQKRNFSIATIWIKGGSNMDRDKKRGINQMLCSLLTRGCEGFDNFQLSDFVESHGAELNHEVLEDGMLISIKSLNKHFDKLIKLLDLISNKPTLSEKQFNFVKKSLINLIKKEKENYFNVTLENWRRIVYSNHPYAFNTIGYQKDVSNIKYADILNEYEDFKKRKKYCISNNKNINGKSLEVLDQIISKRKFNFQNHAFSQKERFISSHNNTNQVIIILGNQTCSIKSSDYFLLKLLESYLSYGMSSLLFKLFREENGITYDLGVLNPLREENSPFCIYLSVSNQNALQAFEVLSKLWKELLYSLISKAELYLAKEKLKSSLLLGKQSLEDILHRNIQLISYGVKPKSESEYFSVIDDISPENIQKLNSKFFAKPFLSVTGDKIICNNIKTKWVNEF